MLTFIVYMFAGAEEAAINELNLDAIRVLAKLVVLTKNVLGSITSLDDVGKFCLLDIDASCIPSDARGIVRHGKSTSSQMLPVDEQCAEPVSNLLADAEHGNDYSVHIEPE